MLIFTYLISRMGSFVSQLLTVAEFWQIKVGAFSRFRALNYRGSSLKIYLLFRKWAKYWSGFHFWWFVARESSKKWQILKKCLKLELSRATNHQKMKIRKIPTLKSNERICLKFCSWPIFSPNGPFSEMIDFYGENFLFFSIWNFISNYCTSSNW
jgi:hypothetical protein